MSDETLTTPTRAGRRPPPPRLFSSRQFPAPEQHVTTGAGSGSAGHAWLAAEQAAIASIELLDLQAELTETPGVPACAAALERTYGRLVDWRHRLAVEAHHLDPSRPEPVGYRRSWPADDTPVAHFGAPAELHARLGTAQRASLQLDDLVRDRVAAHGGARAAGTIVVLADGRTIDGSRIVLAERTSTVVPAAGDTQRMLHDAALHALAELLCGAELPVRETFADATFLLYQAPLYRLGSDDVLRTLLVVVADFLFVRPLVLPADLDAHAQVRPQTDLPGIQGFRAWFAARLPDPDR